MVTLTAGVVWVVASPVAALDCPDTPVHASSPAVICDDISQADASQTGGSQTGGPQVGPQVGSQVGSQAQANGSVDDGRLAATESIRLAHGAAELARRLGLAGLASARAASGLSDLGGTAATSSMPGLSTGAPARPASSSVTRLPDVPDLPGRPTAPGLPESTVEMSVAAVPDAEVAGTDVRSPLELPRPVHEIKDELIARTLPQAPGTVGGVNDTTQLPDSLDGFTGLLHNLRLSRP